MQRRISRKALAIGAGVALVAGGVALAPYALAQTNFPTTSMDEPELVPSDYLPNPLAEARSQAREDAVAGVLSGRYQTTQDGVSTVVDFGSAENSAARNSQGGRDDRGRGGHTQRYVELERETTDKIFVILAEFGDERHPTYPDIDSNPDWPGPTRFDGPSVNQIPQPNRAVDNSTVWRPDFSQEYFQDLYFGEGESLKNYYEAQSSGRYSVDGVVTDWVKVPFNQARYGREINRTGCEVGATACNNVWALIADAANQWVADQLAAGRSLAEVQTELAEFDTWDRYDFDVDGNFNEPDGFIDHFQIVHAGGDQADQDPIYGEDAIWSHRWYAAVTAGPHPGFPGAQIGNTGFWVGDYTIQPENGGRSVFYHEYAHDLDLPDDYNNQLGGDNNNEHWTLMAQSRLGAKQDEGIGERGGDLGAWNKLQLGWLDYELVQHDGRKTVQLGPEEYNSRLPQAVVVNLPPSIVLEDRGEPFAGEFQWYSGHQNNNARIVMTRTATVPATDPTLRFQTHFDIETEFDYAYVAVNGTKVAGTIGGQPTVPFPTDSDESWYGTEADWVPAEFDLSAYAGQTVQLEIVYQTDPAAGGNDPALPDGLFLDDISLGDFSDGAEAGVGDWTVAGWVITAAQQEIEFPRFYIAGWRSYVSYDKYLKTGPYYFGYGAALPDKVDHYAYQTGLLISYWNTLFENNDTMLHPGEGRNLYIDAHPQPFARSDGQLWRARIQVYDAPFGKTRTDTVRIHHDGVLQTFGGLPGNPVFNDTDQYWFQALPNHGVKLPAFGVTIRVQNVSGGKMQVMVN